MRLEQALDDCLQNHYPEGCDLFFKNDGMPIFKADRNWLIEPAIPHRLLRIVCAVAVFHFENIWTKETYRSSEKSMGAWRNVARLANERNEE